MLRVSCRFGFDFFVVGRIDFQEKAARFSTKTMETVWRPRNDSRYEIMTHVLDPIQFYSYPPGFAFEGDQRTWINQSNVASRAQEFAAFIHKKAAGYKTNSLLVPFGSDFQYTNASINYENLDKLMAYMNDPANQARFGMRLRYSTPTEYMKTLHSKDVEWPIKVDDFESYAIGPDQFLVGFYSSRPDYKGMVRRMSSQLRAGQIALTNAVVLHQNTSVDTDIEIAALDTQTKFLSVSQHHDAITSSQRRHVHRDYIAQLSAGQKSVDSSISRVVASTIRGPATSTPSLVTCPYVNESSCPASQWMNSTTEGVVLVLQNPTAHSMSQVAVRIPVNSLFLDQRTSLLVEDGMGTRVASQLLPPWPASPFVHNKTLRAPAPVVVFFCDVPALGTSTYFLKAVAEKDTNYTYEYPKNSTLHELELASHLVAVLDNGKLRAEFDDVGLLRSIQKGSVRINVTQSLIYYRASDGTPGPNNPYQKQGAGGSGNYIFQPDGPRTYKFAARPNVTVLHGDLVSEVRHVFVEGSIEQVWRLYKGSDVLEVEYRIGPINISDGVGKEVLPPTDFSVAHRSV